MGRLTRTRQENLLKYTDLFIKKSTPGVRLTGTETGAKDITVRENAGRLEAYDEAAAASLGYLNPWLAAKVVDIAHVKQIPEISTTSTTAAEIDRDYGKLAAPPSGVKPRIFLSCEAYNSTGDTVTVRARIGTSTASLSTTSTTYEALSTAVDAAQVDDWFIVEFLVSAGTGYVRNLIAALAWETA